MKQDYLQILEQQWLRRAATLKLTTGEMPA